MKEGNIAQGRRLAILMLVVADYLSLLAAEGTALGLQGIFRVNASSMMSMPWDYQYLYIPGMFLLIMLLAEGYRFNRPSLEMARDVFRGICFGFLMYMLLIFLMRNSMQISRYYAGCFWLFTFVYVALGRYVVGRVVLRAEALQERVLLIGAGRTAERLLAAFQDDFCYCYKVIGVLDDHPVSDSIPKKYPLLGGFDDAARVIREQGVQTVIVAAPGLSEEGMRKLLMDIQHLTDTVLFTPNLVGSPLGSVEISTLFVEQVAVIKSKNNLSRWYNRWFKFCFDIVMTVTGSILLSPFILLLALVVGIDNKGRVIFAHRRVGRNGKPFSCYKFQTMVKDADKALVQYLSENADARKEWERSFKLADDPRVTRLGAFLRRTSLDELPQIVNVLKGEMSLVGPRPIVEAEMEMYGENIREYLMVRPGITGMWQTSGRSDTTYEERVQMDTWYVRNWSV
uniref:undecaprenyl-phosphate galactose phosphotransferase WbaP n=1 Tax=Anaerovibrio slackiae TaxID=2652309 RepID=UPI0038702357